MATQENIDEYKSQISVSSSPWQDARCMFTIKRHVWRGTHTQLVMYATQRERERLTAIEMITGNQLATMVRGVWTRRQ
ncbi:hypothetical protein PAXRUDRAFT_826987 [Paxillus rubicundulus Ve08.2h10]|uniref:Uncharacterized protein n=1 Tax=Paxillus rubicundulus Ve08.2h10 TaxID=930991 RepID=A0A0D0DRD6_9AGAM|nr:hypothetical protein PAXRUDRAFT_826987 [Paxillus rubicundulus Ve08.2h10]